ncbi:Cystathionine gamma-synthase/O-acetylhomoserine (thiol)-lyase [Paraliobacillus sp. PM-2]|uniref:methionine biosynthesis PLP-dependent protein n=1 Tax=Paraliobacillus sp. PM-2 TaxID=1462524 RepID=UPI00061BAC58|nr:methionine biosynthesis PLP-dependent protein [Paraliobacillus sp. PM-2]CQR46351.1 Cystathionine gamma-synthase/O-acetylhomoserine (thiol)-lyase [Paraliobacillus sp. PM-2]
MKEYKIQTKLAQLGNHSDPRTGAVNPPIYLSTAYQHKGLGKSTGYDYTRTENPTRSILEDGIADLEKGDRGFACSSGMAAIQLVLSLFSTGDELIAPEDVYGGTYRLFKHYQEAYDVKTTYCSFNDLEKVEQFITSDTKAIFIETPTNPLMQEIDITSYAALAKKYQLLFIVDNTFLTPILQQPISLGADIVIHSATKYIGGHNDVLAGLVVTKGLYLSEKMATFHNASGAVLSSLDAWLLVRGLKTLSLRVRQQQHNAKQIAAFLEADSRIDKVLYPGKGGMLSFRLKKAEWVAPFLENLQLITFAESLGGVESFVTYPTTQTHADIPENERISRGIDDRLLRFSTGIEDVADLITDFRQCMNQL